MLFFVSFYLSENPNNNIKGCFLTLTIMRNVSSEPNKHIRMIYEASCDTEEWFMKDHVTLKTGVMMPKISFAITEINDI